MISIIIPTFNEEKYLPALLSSIKKQQYKNYEIIIADAGSTDNTLQIAKKYNCRIIPGGLPAAGRNKGAKIAKGNYLLFLDADVVLKKNFLKNTISEFETKDIDIATSYIIPLSNKKIDFILHNAVNVYFRITQRFYPHAPGFCILIKKNIHNAINGFDEKIKLAEDHDYVRRARKYGKFRILYFSKIFVSIRRLETDGRFNVAIKYILCEIHRMIIGEVRTNIFNYKFGHYGQITKNQNVKIPKLIPKKLKKIMSQLLRKNGLILKNLKKFKYDKKKFKLTRNKK